MRSSHLIQVLFLLLVFEGCRVPAVPAYQKGGASSYEVSAPIIDEEEILRRTRLEFTLSQEDVDNQLLLKLGSCTPEEFRRYENLNWLESRIIDGEKRYFKRSVRNVMLMQERERGESFSGLVSNNLTKICLDNATKITESTAKDPQKRVAPVKMVVTYTLVVDDGAVPDGDTVRCWLPFPREDHNRQSEVELIFSQPVLYTLSPLNSTHRTIYLEQVAVKGHPTEFSIRFGYQSDGFYKNVRDERLIPYDVSEDLYTAYTREEAPHIAFSDRIKRLSDSIVGKATDPRMKVSLIYHWIHKNIPWSGALEYSVMPNISEYVLDNMRGDCGMQTFLFMSMARYQGVPVKWQSGWMMHPGEVNLHDWCEVYFQGIGWVPLDMSFGLLPSDRREINEFYLSGIDSYRLIVNEGIAGELYPSKKFPRSEPFDFQRGEVEWSGGNLYFNQWKYSMKVEYQH
jgi:transglutaminase-like putative cysteine protease